MYKAIYFDFGGVIGSDAFWSLLRERLDDFEQKRPYFSGLANRLDKDELEITEFETLVAQELAISADELWPTVSSRIIINQELLTLMEMLKASYKIGLLSNFTHHWLEDLIEKKKLTSYFDVQFISSRYKLIKPEKKAYEKALSLLGVQPKETIFIDNLQRNVDAANEIGITGLLFTDNKTLKKDLRRLGIQM